MARNDERLASFLEALPPLVRALRYGFSPCREKVIAAPHRPVGRLSSGDEPRRLQGASDMFNDIWIARKSALSLARTLMVVTMVIVMWLYSLLERRASRWRSCKCSRCAPAPAAPR